MSRVAMYDVNVYANTLRDVLIRIDVIGLVQAKWTDRILEETFDNLKATRQDLSAQQLDWTRGLMNVAYLPRQSRRRQNSSSPRISTTSRCTWWPSSAGQLDAGRVRVLFGELSDRLGYTTARECVDLLTATYRTGQLLPRHRYIAEEVATRAHAQRDAPTSGPAKRRPEQNFDGGFRAFVDR